VDAIGYGTNYFEGGQCVDNCDKLGEGYECDAEACLCRKDNDSTKVYCAANTDDALERGIENRTQSRFDSASKQCVDNCKEVYPEGYVCNPESCLCEPTERAEISCSFNTDYVDATDTNVYKASQLCKDDCAEYMGSDYECNAGSCTCTRKKQEIDCATNYINDVFDFSGDNTNPFKAGMICNDNCDALSFMGDYVCNAATCKCEAATLCASNTLDSINEGKNGYNSGTVTAATKPPMCADNCEKVLGEGFTCDIQSCICRPSTDGGKINCAANTGNAYINDAIGTSAGGYSSSYQCVDDCAKNYDDGMVCDAASCYCVPGEGMELSCTGHTEYVSLIDINKFNSASMKCEDDCAEYMGSGYECNAQSCTCTRKQDAAKVSCAGNSGTTTSSLDERYPDGWACADDCAEKLGTGYSCDPESCTCGTSTSPMVSISCASNNMTSAGLDQTYGYTGWECKDDCDTLPGGDFYCDSTSCVCTMNLTIGKCGDGEINYGEDCDYGSAETNRCPESGDTSFPDYCTESCQCKKIEHSPRCGDGKITGTEGCDGGNVKTAICASGYKCDTPSCSCIVEEGTGQCGDGRVTAPEECDHGNSYTDDCPSGKTCYSCKCIDPSDVPEEAYCGNNKREGAEECDGNDDSACGSNEYCSYCKCAKEAQDLYCGDDIITSPEECEDDKDCSSGEHCSGCQCVGESVTYYCGDGVVTGNEQCENEGQCSGNEICYNCQCLAPPSVDCQSFCASEGYSVNLGSGYTGESCSAAAAEDEVMCMVTCVYVQMGSWSNPAGTTTCCCKDVYRESCPSLPLGGCDCPDDAQVENVICPAHAP
jgi:formylmethanofuran dehydrogenase subunit D